MKAQKVKEDGTEEPAELLLASEIQALKDGKQTCLICEQTYVREDGHGCLSLQHPTTPSSSEGPSKSSLFSPSSGEYRCVKCAKVFQLKQYLTLHQRGTCGGHPCLHCNKSSKSLSKLKLHIQEVHEGQKPFVCSDRECGKAFSRKTNRDIHIRRIHEGEKPFACPETSCPKVFRYKMNLDCHFQTVHLGHTRASCPACALIFKYKGSRDKHMRNFH